MRTDTPKQVESEKDNHILCDLSSFALVFLPPQNAQGFPDPLKQHPGLAARHYPYLGIMQGFLTSVVRCLGSLK